MKQLPITVGFYSSLEATALIPVHPRQAPDAVPRHAASEVIQQSCESGATCLALYEHGCTVDTLWLSDDMLETFINLEACYRQQGIADSAVHAFHQLARSGSTNH